MMYKYLNTSVIFTSSQYRVVIKKHKQKKVKEENENESDSKESPGSQGSSPTSNQIPVENNQGFFQNEMTMNQMMFSNPPQQSMIKDEVPFYVYVIISFDLNSVLI